MQDNSEKFILNRHPTWATLLTYQHYGVSSTVI